MTRKGDVTKRPLIWLDFDSDSDPRDWQERWDEFQDLARERDLELLGSEESVEDALARVSGPGADGIITRFGEWALIAVPIGPQDPTESQVDELGHLLARVGTQGSSNRQPADWRSALGVPASVGSSIRGPRPIKPSLRVQEFIAEGRNAKKSLQAIANDLNELSWADPGKNAARWYPATVQRAIERGLQDTYEFLSRAWPILDEVHRQGAMERKPFEELCTEHRCHPQRLLGADPAPNYGAKYCPPIEITRDGKVAIAPGGRQLLETWDSVNEIPPELLRAINSFERQFADGSSPSAFERVAKGFRLPRSAFGGIIDLGSDGRMHLTQTGRQLSRAAAATFDPDPLKRLDIAYRPDDSAVRFIGSDWDWEDPPYEGS